METNTKFLRDIKEALDEGDEEFERIMQESIATNDASADDTIEQADAEEGLSIASFDSDGLAIETMAEEVSELASPETENNTGEIKLATVEGEIVSTQEAKTPDAGDALALVVDENSSENETHDETPTHDVDVVAAEQQAIAEIAQHELASQASHQTTLEGIHEDNNDIHIDPFEENDLDENNDEDDALDLSADEFDGSFKATQIAFEETSETENSESLSTQNALDDALMHDEEKSEAEIENDNDDQDDIPDMDAVDQSQEDLTQPKISKIGQLLLELGKITKSDTKRIIRAQKKHGMLFGDAALKLGLINNDDIQKVVAMQFNYHYLQAGQGKFSEDLVAAYAPFSKKVEAYRALRSQLMMRWFKKGNRMLTVVSANAGEGVSYLTANMGVVFSQLGARTLIIEANMRSPRMGEIFNMADSVGLSDVIVGRSGVEAVREIASIPDLSVLSAGTVPPNPQELLGRTSFSLLLKTLKDNYDVILIDTPPVVESADAQSAIEIAGGALLVSRLDHTRHTDIIHMRNQIEMTGAKVVGALMNEY